MEDDLSLFCETWLSWKKCTEHECLVLNLLFVAHWITRQESVSRKQDIFDKINIIYTVTCKGMEERISKVPVRYRFLLLEDDAETLSWFKMLIVQFLFWMIDFAEIDYKRDGNMWSGTICYNPDGNGRCWN